MRKRLTIIILLISAGINAQRDLPGSNVVAHGTVNIILANGQGLVAETDSQLSNDGHPVGAGQKLFNLDNRSICTIAGFYMDSGPLFAGDRIAPVYTVVPAIVKAFVAERPVSTLSIETKAKLLSNVLSFSLSLEPVS